MLNESFYKILKCTELKKATKNGSEGETCCTSRFTLCALARAASSRKRAAHAIHPQCAAMAHQQAICCSAPGKVLITGGYLVLERPNPGIVFTVNARFYTVIQPLPVEHVGGQQKEDGKARIKVISPQFNSTLEYTFQWIPVVSLEKM